MNIILIDSKHEWVHTNIQYLKVNKSDEIFDFVTVQRILYLAKLNNCEKLIIISFNEKNNDRIDKYRALAFSQQKDVIVHFIEKDWQKSETSQSITSKILENKECHLVKTMRIPYLPKHLFEFSDDAVKALERNSVKIDKFY